MSTGNSELTRAFVEHQRERLVRLRDQFLHGTAQAEAEELDLSQRHGNEVQDSGDEGAIEAHRDSADAFSAEGRRRLEAIRRALDKIAEGSYGLSDDSGAPIGRERLQAVPEARFTVEEEARRERSE